MWPLPSCAPRCGPLAHPYHGHAHVRTGPGQVLWLAIVHNHCLSGLHTIHNAWVPCCGACAMLSPAAGRAECKLQGYERQGVQQGLELAVPGTYLAGEPVVTIASFAPQLHVITSKQRPRKLTIYGSDGAEYMFLLKVTTVNIPAVSKCRRHAGFTRLPAKTQQACALGASSSVMAVHVGGLNGVEAGLSERRSCCEQGHEDLRQDERVMQLFGLVNSMLAHDRATAERDLSIARYAVIPLSPNSGGPATVHPCSPEAVLVSILLLWQSVVCSPASSLLLGFVTGAWMQRSANAWVTDLLCGPQA